MARTDPAEKPQEDPSALPTIYIGVVGILGTIVAILASHWIYYAVDRSIEEENVTSAAMVEFASQETAQRERLQQYRWTDKENEIAGIPIEEAMRKIVEENRKR